MMRLLQEESELEEIVKLVGMDALGAADRLKLEAARSIREDFLHQNSFHEVDTYTPLDKQRRMMQLVLGYYEKCSDALGKGGSGRAAAELACAGGHRPVQDIVPEQVDSEYEKIQAELDEEIAGILSKKEEY